MTVGQVVVIALAAGVGYIYWQTYRQPSRNALTRFIHGYVDRTHLPGLTTEAAELVVAVTMWAVAIGAFGFFLWEVFIG